MRRRRLLLAGGAGMAAAALGATGTGFAASRPEPNQGATANQGTTAKAGPEPTAWETVIGPETFNDYGAFEAAWNYLYPWGSDHNGTARMYGDASDHNHIYIESAGVLTLKATRITWDEGNSSADPYLPIHYHSGTVHAKENVLVNDQYPSWEVKGEFQAPASLGTWPAFWLTGADSWPPESDILEYKGSAENWFNTYDGEWENTTVPVSDPGAWHEYRAWITKATDTDVDIHYYLDGEWVGQHLGSNFVDAPMHIIINLQMEGSAGEPGPDSDTIYNARNVYVGRSNEV